MYTTVYVKPHGDDLNTVTLYVKRTKKDIVKILTDVSITDGATEGYLFHKGEKDYDYLGFEMTVDFYNSPLFHQIVNRNYISRLPVEWSE